MRIHRIMRAPAFAILSFITLPLESRAQSIDQYSGFIERRTFQTWSEALRSASNLQQSTDFTETQVTLVRIERGKATATYQVSYDYGTKSSGAGAFMDGRCPFSKTTDDAEVQVFPEQGVPASPSLGGQGENFRIGVMFQEPAVGVRTARSTLLWSYNRGGKFCPDNPDKNESSAKQSLRQVPGITISATRASDGSFTGSVTTPGSTVNAKPGRIETAWETVRWALFPADGPQCTSMAADKVQFYRNLHAEMNRVEKERNEVARKARDAGTDGKSSPAEVSALYAQRDALTRQLRDLSSQATGSPFWRDQFSGAPLGNQAFASSGCGTKG